MNHERRAVGPDARRDIRAPQFYPETVEPSEDDALQRRTMDQLGLSYATMFHSQRGPLALRGMSPTDPYLNEIDSTFDPYALVNALSSWYSDALAPLIDVTIEVTRMSPPARYVKRDQLGLGPPRMIFHASLMERRNEFAAHALNLMREYHRDMLYPDQATLHHFSWLYDGAENSDDGAVRIEAPPDEPTPDDSWIRHTRGFEWRCTAEGQQQPRCRAEASTPLRTKMREDHRLVDGTFHGMYSDDVIGAHWLPEHDRACNGRFEMVYRPNVAERRQLQLTYADLTMCQRRNAASNELLRRRLQELHETSVLRRLEWCREHNLVLYVDGIFHE